MNHGLTDSPTTGASQNSVERPRDEEARTKKFYGVRGFFASLYHYREFLTQSVVRDLKRRYKRSSLGYLWSMLNPLLMMIVLTVVFSHLLPRVENYSVFLFSALLAWQYFSGTVTESLGSIQSHLKIIEQVPIPKYMFTLSIAFSNIVNFLLSLVALLLVMLVVGQPFTLTVLSLPIVFLPLFFMTLAIALFTAAASVFFEDVKHLTRVVLAAWYYLTPVLYGPEMMPPHRVKYLHWNPLYFPVDFMRGIFYRGELPDLTLYLVVLAGSLVSLFLALAFFKKCDDKFLYFV